MPKEKIMILFCTNQYNFRYLLKAVQRYVR